MMNMVAVSGSQSEYQQPVVSGRMAQAEAIVLLCVCVGGRFAFERIGNELWQLRLDVLCNGWFSRCVSVSLDIQIVTQNNPSRIRLSSHLRRCRNCDEDLFVRRGLCLSLVCAPRSGIAIMHSCVKSFCVN